jgi:alginate O-acetyltransferase complex protein AlgI
MPLFITSGILFLALLLYWNKNFNGIKPKNLILLVASYGCYALWDWKFLILVIFITFVNFGTGYLISSSPDRKRRTIYLIISIVINLLVLVVFRYYNFFIERFSAISDLLGFKLSLSVLKIGIPLGITIFTLQALSYSIEVYRDRIKPAGDFIPFAAYVAFFPQMFSGPVERATTLLPQYLGNRQFDKGNIYSGLKLIIWGIFKKVVIANNFAIYANEIFNNYTDYSGLTILAGLVSFAIQIYGELSGLSDIATGTARLFGINLTINFRFPYLSRNLNEFWNKWNISLIGWLKEYIYLPVEKTRKGNWIIFLNLFVLFCLVGLWHGGNISVVAFGLFNALLVVPSVIKPANPKKESGISLKGTLIPLIGYLVTAIIILAGLTLFRSNSIHDAYNILLNLSSNLFTVSVNELRSLGNGFTATISNVLILIFYLFIEWLYRKEEYVLKSEKPDSLNTREIVIIVLIIIIVLFFNQPGDTTLIINN